MLGRLGDGVSPLPDFAGFVFGVFLGRLAQQFDYFVLSLVGTHLGKYVVLNRLAGYLGVGRIGDDAARQSKPDEADGEKWKRAEMAGEFHQDGMGVPDVSHYLSPMAILHISYPSPARLGGRSFKREPKN